MLSLRSDTATATISKVVSGAATTLATFVEQSMADRRLTMLLLAVFAGLASYPLAAVGAVGVGLLEAFGSFWASAFKEVIVFTLIIPVLLWRSFQHGHHDEEE